MLATSSPFLRPIRSLALNRSTISFNCSWARNNASRISASVIFPSKVQLRSWYSFSVRPCATQRASNSAYFFSVVYENLVRRVELLLAHLLEASLLELFPKLFSILHDTPM